jgi:hypothetical protein
MLKYLRIAVTVLCLTACVLLVALWVRSYWWADWIAPTNSFGVASVRGVLMVDASHGFYTGGETTRSFETKSTERIGINNVVHRHMGFSYRRNGKDWALQFPYWFVVVLVASVAAAPWISWRFSLRTLLIATTLIAVALGLVAFST